MVLMWFTMVLFDVDDNGIILGYTCMVIVVDYSVRIGIQWDLMGFTQLPTSLTGHWYFVGLFTKQTDIAVDHGSFTLW